MIHKNKKPGNSPAIAVAAALLAVLAGCGGSDKPPDSDNDGFADTVDCAVQDAQAWQVVAYASRDSDGDGFRVNASGQVCTGASLPPIYSAQAVSGAEVDCDDTSAARFSMRRYEAVDTDGDGFAVALAGEMCSGATLPAGYLAALPATAADCDDADASAWHPWSFASRDDDGDGYRVNTAGTFCGQDALPAHLNVAVTPGRSVDCLDTDVTRWQYKAVYRDGDGDGTGAGAAQFPCMGATPPAGFVLSGYDPADDPNDPSSTTVSTFTLPSTLLDVDDDGDDDD